MVCGGKRGFLCQLCLAVLLLALLFCGTVFCFYSSALLPLFRHVLNAAIFASCKDAHTPSFDPSEMFTWAEEFRAEWKHIRAELHTWEHGFGAVPTFADLDRRQEKVAPHRTWSSLWLKLYGTNSAAARYFPRTMAALARTTASSAMFSIMQPGKGLERHRGDNKAVLRYHLALEVPPPPQGKSEEDEPLRLMVAEKLFYHDPNESRWYVEHTWAEGEHLLFDDSFVHYVENRRSTGRRVVLFVDVPRTDCGLVMNTFFDLVLNPVVNHISRTGRIIANANAYMADAEGLRAEGRERRSDEL